MSSGLVDNSRPPYISFEFRPIEDRNASIAAGHYVAKDVAYVSITRPGSKDSLDKEALVWLAEMRVKARTGGIPQTWMDMFDGAYKAWSQGEELPLEGTPIKTWPILSPSAQKELIHLGIRTVEDLAAMPDNEVSSIGTGAISYKQKAVAWLLAAKDTGKAAEKIAALAQQVEQLAELARKQANELASLRKDTQKA